MSDRRSFLKKSTIGAAGLTIGGMALSSKSYSKIIGANDRLNIALIGLGRRVPAYYDAVSDKANNVEVSYLCDVMKSQREKVAEKLGSRLDYKPKLENDYRRVLEDKNVDAVFIATPDHWHAAGTWMGLEAGKNVYVEKPCSHNPREGELMVAFQKKYGKVVQMGNQQRSMPESIEIIGEIHKGVIGNVYKALAFYTANRGEVPVATKAPVPEGLDWDLFQGPAPRVEYKHNTWDYNWHWYGWHWGTAETGNNATHELDVARWALQVQLPEFVSVEAAKRHFVNDGWTMYDTMEATFRFPENKIIVWDGKSRNGFQTYGADRGTIIYGSEGTVYVNRGGYKLVDRMGKVVRTVKAPEEGVMATLHVVNFFDAVRGKVKQNSPIAEGAKSTLLCHLANISSRIGKPLQCNPTNGVIKDQAAMKLWSREYEKGWGPKL
jgi:predicted dehydrogenase